MHYRSSVVINLLAILIGISTATLSAKSKETVQEIEQTVKKEFCSKKSQEDAKKECEEWIAAQKTTLKDRILISWCSTRQAGDAKGCLYNVEGEISYVLRKVTKENEK